MSFRGRLVDVCDVYTASVSKSAASGAPTTTLTKTGEDVACLIQATASSRKFSDRKLIGAQVYTGFFLFGQGPQETDDEIEWRGRRLVCVGMPRDPSGTRHHEETTLAEPVNA